MLNKKKDGFAGQKAVVIPRKILSDQCAENTIIASLYTTDIGFYPHAKFHYRVRMHGADQNILIYCIEGKGGLKINKKEYAIGGGSFFVIPANVAHTYKADENEPWTIYWLHFKGTQAGAIVNLLIKQLNGNVGLLSFNEDQIRLFTEIYTHLEKGYSTDNLTYANMCLWHYSQFVYFQW